MDFLYVAKRVPYPLTVEVYGGGGYGKLQPGEWQEFDGDLWLGVETGLCRSPEDWLCPA
jgi:hypothetical protein